MTSFSDKSKRTLRQPCSVVFVVYPDIKLLDLAGPLQVFADAGEDSDGPGPYKISVVSMAGGKVQTDTLVSIETEAMSHWRRRKIHTLIVVGGMGSKAAYRDQPFVREVAKLVRRSRRVCSVCSGALVLAATGVLNKRRAVTHWSSCRELAQDFPDVQVEVDPIFVKDGYVWTSAGVTAGIDLALAMVAEDFGRGASLEIARSLVTYMVRPGGQSQFSPALDRHALEPSARFYELHDWIAGHLHEDLSVEQLAARMNMSGRNFSRVYTAEMGITPAKSVETFRVEAARQLLENTSHSIKSVAARCGFVDDERMRRAFMRSLQIAPNDYRQRFQVLSE